jgi:hypothetical protein
LLGTLLLGGHQIDERILSLDQNIKLFFHSY